MRRYSIAFAISLGLAAAFVHLKASASQRPRTRSSSSGLELDSIDRRTDACTDFYQFACGGWVAQHPIPPDLPGTGRGREMRERTFAVLSRILARPGADRERQKASDYYTACMDEPGIEAKGIASLEPVLSRIAGLSTREEVPALVAFLHSMAAQPEIPQRQPAYSALFDFKSQHEVPREIASVSQGGTTLPIREMYLSSDARFTSLKAMFIEHVRKMFTMLGASPDEATAGARAVLGVETLLVPQSAETPTEQTLNPHPIALADLQRLTPHFSWSEYLRAASAPTITTIDVPQPAFMRSVDSIVADAPIADLKRYLTWQVVHASVLMLPLQFREADFDFFKRTLKGQQQLEPRSQLCIMDTDDRFGDVLGKAFVERTFHVQSKSDIVAMLRAIKTAMSTEIDTASWISAETKSAAKAKLAAVVDRIGYPGRWRSYSSLRITKNDALGNLQRALAFDRTEDLRKIGRDGDRDEWHRLTPSRDESGYRVDLNEIIFPAGFLQPPFYSAARDAAVNYGAIGTVMGHEVTHGFDDVGRQFDKHGNWSNWWTDADANAFQQRAACLVDQYSQYRVADGTKVNAKLTLDENIADNGGIRLALMAYLAGPGAQSPSTLDGFTPPQRVFLGWAQASCENVRPEAERQRTTTDSHAPNRYRVNGALSNMPEFQRAFSCKADAPMVRQKACRVW
jgi:putative endopeptidase